MYLRLEVGIFFMENQEATTQAPPVAATAAPGDDAVDALEQRDVPPPAGQPEGSSSGAPKKPKSRKPGDRLKGLNIYLIMFIFIMVVALIIVAASYLQSQRSNTAKIKTQTLTQEDLKKVAASDATIGNNQQILTIQSSAVFAGKVLIKDGLEVAGNLQIGGTVGLNNLTISGTTQMGQAQVNRNLSVAGDTALQGGVTIARSLQVNGGATITGGLSAAQITTSSLQLNSDLTLTRHIVVGGGTPGRSNGSALGSGGTSSVSGSDTAGTLQVNTGSGTGAGCFATINFTTRYNGTPRVQITPVGSAAGAIDYYVNRSATNFSICTANAAPTGSSFAFDYFVVN